MRSSGGQVREYPKAEAALGGLSLHRRVPENADGESLQTRRHSSRSSTRTSGSARGYRARPRAGVNQLAGHRHRTPPSICVLLTDLFLVDEVLKGHKL
jgi:hypothetical protein